MTKSDAMFTGNELPRGHSLVLFVAALFCGAIACGALSSVGNFPRHWDIHTQLQKQYEIYYLATCVNSSTKAGIPIQMRAMCDEAHVTMRQSPLVRALIDTLDTLNIFKEGYALYLLRNIAVTVVLPCAVALLALYLLYDGVSARLSGAYTRSSLPALLPEQQLVAKKLQ
jgi:hypothetical protein